MHNLWKPPCVKVTHPSSFAKAFAEFTLYEEALNELYHPPACLAHDHTVEHATPSDVGSTHPPTTCIHKLYNMEPLASPKPGCSVPCTLSVSMHQHWTTNNPFALTGIVTEAWESWHCWFWHPWLWHGDSAGLATFAAPQSLCGCLVARMKGHYAEPVNMMLKPDTQSLQSSQMLVVVALCEPCCACTLRSLVHVAPTLCSQARTLWWLSCRSMIVQLLRIIIQSAHVTS